MQVTDVPFIIHGGLYYYDGVLVRFNAYRGDFNDPLKVVEKQGGRKLLQSRLPLIEPVPLNEEFLIRFGFSNAKNPFAPMGKENNPEEYYQGDTTNYYNIRTHEFCLMGKSFYCVYVHNMQMAYRSMGLIEPFKMR